MYLICNIITINIWNSHHFENKLNADDVNSYYHILLLLYILLSLKSIITNRILH